MKFEKSYKLYFLFNLIKENQSGVYESLKENILISIFTISGTILVIKKIKNNNILKKKKKKIYRGISGKNPINISDTSSSNGGGSKDPSSQDDRSSQSSESNLLEDIEIYKVFEALQENKRIKPKATLDILYKKNKKCQKYAFDLWREYIKNVREPTMVDEESSRKRSNSSPSQFSYKDEEKNEPNNYSPIIDPIKEQDLEDNLNDQSSDSLSYSHGYEENKLESLEEVEKVLNNNNEQLEKSNTIFDEAKIFLEGHDEKLNGNIYNLELQKKNAERFLKNYLHTSQTLHKEENQEIIEKLKNLIESLDLKIREIRIKKLNHKKFEESIKNIFTLISNLQENKLLTLDEEKQELNKIKVDCENLNSNLENLENDDFEDSFKEVCFTNIKKLLSLIELLESKFNEPIKESNESNEAFNEVSDLLNASIITPKFSSNIKKIDTEFNELKELISLEENQKEIDTFLEQYESIEEYNKEILDEAILLKKLPQSKDTLNRLSFLIKKLENLQNNNNNIKEEKTDNLNFSFAESEENEEIKNKKDPDPTKANEGYEGIDNLSAILESADVESGYVDSEENPFSNNESDSKKRIVYEETNLETEIHLEIQKEINSLINNLNKKKYVKNKNMLNTFLLEQKNKLGKKENKEYKIISKIDRMLQILTTYQIEETVNMKMLQGLQVILKTQHEVPKVNIKGKSMVNSLMEESRIEVDIYEKVNEEIKNKLETIQKLITQKNPQNKEKLYNFLTERIDKINNYQGIKKKQEMTSKIQKMLIYIHKYKGININKEMIENLQKILNDPNISTNNLSTEKNNGDIKKITKIKEKIEKNKYESEVYESEVIKKKEIKPNLNKETKLTKEELKEREQGIFNEFKTEELTRDVLNNLNDMVSNLKKRLQEYSQIRKKKTVCCDKVRKKLEIYDKKVKDTEDILDKNQKKTLNKDEIEKIKNIWNNTDIKTGKKVEEKKEVVNKTKIYKENPKEIKLALDDYLFDNNYNNRRKLQNLLFS